MSHYAAGVTASLVAEALFIGMIMIVSAMRGVDPWKVTKLPGAFLLGPAAAEPAGFVAGDVATGMLMHLFFSILVGVIYAWALPRARASPVVAGLITGQFSIVLGSGFSR